MIKAINYGLAVSDEGFRVKIDRTYVSYVEGDYALRILRYVLKEKPYTVVCDFDHIEGWFPPHSNEVVTQEAKEKIMKRVGACLEILFSQGGGYECQIHRDHHKIIAIIKLPNAIRRHEESKCRLDEIRRKLPD